MIDKNDFEDMLTEMENIDNQRELLIKSSRDVLKLSKQLIYALHRGDKKASKAFETKIKLVFNKLSKIVGRNYELQGVGAFKVAEQEYVEALCYYGFVINKKIPTHKELKVSSNAYLLGICDLTGELVRKAINDAIKGDMKSAFFIKKIVEDLYGELLKFDFRNGELRKKFDGIKYDLKRLENVALDIKLKGK
ncbi:hypothetical protein A3K72_04005 [Candidatus Woesearchaeota archaeon RBG_13_36_6]|nr:MAG: hypothetical protein A3K72_04005 [Candidatus Woesearchaeota archaeon RBG_13_36_6]